MPQDPAPEQLNLEQWWPELFEGLDARKRHGVRNALASSWHEGWIPNRRDVQNLTDRARGTITEAEYLARARQAAHDAAAAQQE